jgi:hypothetical protein
MGLVTTKLTFTNPRDPTIAPIEVPALADTGSVFLCIPEHVRLQLKLEIHDTREVKLADGTYHSYPYVGPIPMDEMDLVVNPQDRTVDVNPASPNIASGIVKRAAWPDTSVHGAFGNSLSTKVVPGSPLK